jgi:putative cardiolipin synthase
VRKSLMTELLRARKGVLVSSPYLVPDRSVMEDIAGGPALGPADHGDHQLARVDRRAVRARRLPALPHRDARPRRQDLRGRAEPDPAQQNLGSFGRSIGRFHAKAAAIDGELMFIGSLNFDPRSEKHNTELGLLIHSPELTGQLLELRQLVIDEARFQVKLGPTGRASNGTSAPPRASRSSPRSPTRAGGSGRC